MKKSKFTEGQIAFALKQAETDIAVKEVIRTRQKEILCRITS